MSRSLDSILNEYQNIATQIKKNNKKQTQRKTTTVINKKKPNSKNKGVGKGILNSIINSLPVEMHVPGYNYLGPGTKYDQRINGEYGEDYQLPVNALDAAAMMHDKAYKKLDIASRTKADKALRKEAQMVYNNSYNPWNERATAYAVDKTFALKNLIGAGVSNKKTTGVKRKYTKKSTQVINDNNNYPISSAGYCNDPITISELYDDDDTTDVDES